MSNRNNAPAISLPVPARVGQATAVEQSRAVAEVHAAMLTARDYPRNIDAALIDMERSCRQSELASRAFYRFPRGKETVTGPSIHLARELARCWGNIQHGLHEMSRDDGHGQSEMQAFAWDIEKNTRVASTFIVPHKRDTSNGVKPLVEMRDIYENNTNNGSRRVREAIFAILPPWFVERAKTLCHETMAAGNAGQTLEERIAEAVKAFAGGGITQDRLERKLGKPAAKWDGQDVAQLEVIYNSLRRGEVTKDEEFPPDQVTSSEITGSGPPAPDSQPPAGEPETPEQSAAEQPDPQRENSAPEPPAEQMITGPQQKKMAAAMSEAGLTDRVAALAFVNEVLQRPADKQVTSRNQLTLDEANQVIDALDREANNRVGEPAADEQQGEAPSGQPTSQGATA